MASDEDGYSAPVWLEIDRIDTRPASEIRASVNEEAIEAYAENLGKLPPLKVIRDEKDHHWLEDGYHRYRAAEHLGRAKVKCRIRKGAYLDAFAAAAKANDSHGVRVTKADKRHRVETALHLPNLEEWSQNRIADLCGVSKQLVSKIVAEATVHNGQLKSNTEQPTKKVGKDGKRRSSRSKKRKGSPGKGSVGRESTATPDEDQEEAVASAPPVKVDLPPSPEPTEETPPISTEATSSVVAYVSPTDIPDITVRWADFEALTRRHYDSCPADFRSYFVSKLIFLVMDLRRSHPDIVIRSGNFPA